VFPSIAKRHFIPPKMRSQVQVDAVKGTWLQYFPHTRVFWKERGSAPLDLPLMLLHLRRTFTDKKWYLLVQLPSRFPFSLSHAIQRWKSCESDGVSGGRRAHAAVSRRPPISLSRTVGRTEGYS
jgi:hypothetical protein